MSLSIFPTIFDLIAPAGSHLRVTTTLSSSPCKGGHTLRFPIRDGGPREAGARGGGGG